MGPCRDIWNVPAPSRGVLGHMGCLLGAQGKSAVGKQFWKCLCEVTQFFFFLASFYTLPPMSLREQQIPGYEPMKISSGFG